MKKFWNLMLAALVIIGATACTENYEGVDKVQEAGFSFYAEVVNDGTRAYIDNEDGDKTWNTVWEQGDKLIVEVAEAEQGGGGAFEVEFECMDAAKGQFVSYEDDAANLQGQNVTITTAGTHHSLEGKKAFYTNTVVNGFDNTKPIQLEAHTSFFRYTYNGEGEVKLTLSEPAFRAENGDATKEVTVKGVKGENFIAFWPTGEEVTLSYSIDGTTVKVTKKSFKAGMVYNLGTLAEEPNMTTVYLVPGIWESDNATFSVHYWCGDYYCDVNMVKDSSKSGVYMADVLVGSENLMFKRMDSTGKSEWNKTADLTLPSDNKDHYYITAWGSNTSICAGEWREFVRKEWALSGSFNSWGDMPMTRKDAAISYVSGVSLTAYKDLFKVKEVGSWDTSYGAGFAYMNPGYYMSVGFNGGDVSVTKSGTYDIYFDEVELLVYVVSAGADYTNAIEQTANGAAPVTGNIYYFTPNSNWNQAGAKFVAYFWNGSGNKWVELTNPNGGNVYECNVGEWIPTHVIFLRKNPSGYVYNNWTCWNRIGNIKVPSGKNSYVMANAVWSEQKEDSTGYQGGTWSVK